MLRVQSQGERACKPPARCRRVAVIIRNNIDVMSQEEYADGLRRARCRTRAGAKINIPQQGCVDFIEYRINYFLFDDFAMRDSLSSVLHAFTRMGAITNDSLHACGYCKEARLQNTIHLNFLPCSMRSLG